MSSAFSMLFIEDISTNVGDTTGCKQSHGTCALPEGGVLAWDPVPNEECLYKEMAEWKGSYYWEDETNT